MQVGIGSISCDDETRKAIRREMGQSGLASRADVKKYVEDAIERAFANAGVKPENPPVGEDDAANAARASESEPVTFDNETVEAATPATAPPPADGPAEPPSAGTAVGYTGSAYVPPTTS